MGKAKDFPAVFRQLRKILAKHSRRLVVVKDEDGDFYLDTKHVRNNKKPMFFGAVQIRRAYVSYHLMPVYVFPDLLSGMSDGLKSRMQGKSCFNFKQSDDELFEELKELTNTAFTRFEQEGLLA